VPLIRLSLPVPCLGICNPQLVEVVSSALAHTWTLSAFHKVKVASFWHFRSFDTTLRLACAAIPMVEQPPSDGTPQHEPDGIYRGQHNGAEQLNHAQAHRDISRDLPWSPARGYFDSFPGPAQDVDTPSRSSRIDSLQPPASASEQSVSSTINQGTHGLTSSSAGAVASASRAMPPPTFHVRTPSIPIDDYAQSNPVYFAQSSDYTANVPETVQEEGTAPIAIPENALKSNLSAMSIVSQYSVSPGSAISSPALAALTDITPLPSPLLPGDSPGPWKRAALPRPGSAGSLKSLREDAQVEDFSTSAGTTASPSPRYPSIKKKKVYSTMVPTAMEGNGVNPPAKPSTGNHSRNRSLSEYTPEHGHNVRPRNATVSAPDRNEGGGPSAMHREEYLAESRGLVHSAPVLPTVNSLPTPPPSNRSVKDYDTDESVREEKPASDTITVRDVISGRKTRYRPVRPLGQGTFSKVILATSQRLPPESILNESSEPSLDPSQLVAIKIVGHGPAGGADEERVELSLKREVEILRSISHPSLVNLMSFDFSDTEALLVLEYCPGGDLFDLASSARELLKPAVVQRLFAELVDAVRYLHSKWIVHRDIKLESEFS
jgi:hypothetical protein